MSYSKIEDLHYLYENLDTKKSDAEDLSNLLIDQLIEEGYSDSAIDCFMETADEFAILEKLQMNEGARGQAIKKGVELLKKFGSRVVTGVKRNTPISVRRNVKSGVKKGKEAVDSAKDKVITTARNNPKKTAAGGIATLGTAAVATRGKGEGEKTDDSKSDSRSAYQNAKAEFEKNKERIRNPFGNTTIVTKDGRELKQGDKGFDDALANARKTVRDANNKSLNAADRKSNEKSGLGSGSSSSSSSSTSKIQPAPKLNRETGNPGPRTAPTSQKDEVITKGASNTSGTQSSTVGKSKSQLGGHAGLNAKKIEKRRIEKIKANQPAPTEKDLEDAKKEADTANMMKSSGKYTEVKKDGGTVLQKVKNPDPKNNKLDPTPVKKPVDTAVKPATPVAKPKITARSLMRQRNAEIFGKDTVNNLINKQKDFKTMQKGGTQTPFAASQDKLKPGVAKSQFAAKYPTSNVAKDLKKSKRVTQVMDLESYDPFDIVLGYLQESGQVDSIDEALYIMMEMDAATIQSIVKDFEMLTEEEADRMKDERLEKYGIGHDGSDRKAGSSGRSDSKKSKGKTVLQKETEKKHGKGKSPLEVAKANIIATYGKGAIAPSKKKKKS